MIPEVILLDQRGLYDVQRVPARMVVVTSGLLVLWGALVTVAILTQLFLAIVAAMFVAATIAFGAAQIMTTAIRTTVRPWPDAAANDLCPWCDQATRNSEPLGSPYRDRTTQRLWTPNSHAVNRLVTQRAFDAGNKQSSVEASTIAFLMRKVACVRHHQPWVKSPGVVAGCLAIALGGIPFLMG